MIRLPQKALSLHTLVLFVWPTAVDRQIQKITIQFAQYVHTIHPHFTPTKSFLSKHHLKNWHPGQAMIHAERIADGHRIFGEFMLSYIYKVSLRVWWVLQMLSAAGNFGLNKTENKYQVERELKFTQKLVEKFSNCLITISEFAIHLFVIYWLNNLLICSYYLKLGLYCCVRCFYFWLR